MKLQLLILVTSVAVAYTSSSHTFYKWQKFEFDFPTRRIMKEALANGNLQPENVIPFDVQPYHDYRYAAKTFVTIPRFKSGIPYTLVAVSGRNGKNGPLLRPYPDYKSHQDRNGTNCDAIISAFRVAINECNQMWVIDSGVNIVGNQCPPKLLLIDVKTDEIIHSYHFENSVYMKDASLFVTCVLNVRDPPPFGKCRNTMIYIADVALHGLVVYDYRKNRAWRFESRFMHPDPNNVLHTVANKSFVLMDGMISLATDKKNLYFHPFSSQSEYSIPLRVIENETLCKNKNNIDEFVLKLGRRTRPCVSSVIDSNNNMYCVTFQPTEIIKWNVKKPYIQRHIFKLHIIPKELRFVSGLKISTLSLHELELWMLTNRFQNIATGTQDFNQTNFAVLLWNP